MRNKLRLTMPLLLGLSLLANTVYAEDAQTWRDKGEAALQAAKKIRPNTKPAKNIILFLGDGMGISTITASRIFAGQQQGLDGEGYQLAFEQLPYSALSKTYSANQQTPDSAPTMSAIMTGVKTNDGLLAVNELIKRNEASNQVIQAHATTTLLELAEQHGKATGVVTTTRVTHATPAATYAHISNRDWENDSELPQGSDVPDIARQLLETKVGDGVDVVLGGGREDFMANTQADPEYPELYGKRKDGRNLIADYQAKFGAQYVWNKTQFDAIDPKRTHKLLGLFEPSHVHYEHDRAKDKAGEPSLAEMTAKAIQVLQQNPKGYFLMVEGGRIDHASHEGNAYRTLSETTAFADAVKQALSLVSLDDTLVIVTADHSHTLTIAGYPKRGNPILGKVVSPGQDSPVLAKDGLPYTTLSFANGIPYRPVARADVSNVDTQDPDYHQVNLVPTGAETHAGEDVAIFAGGPDAYLLHGVQEESYIFYVMKDAFRF
ncbi:MAG: alkaline phosphatase [Methylophilus sp.]|jgi:alkaline phosphatase